MYKVLVLGDNLRDLNFIEDALYNDAECFFAFDSARALATYNDALESQEPYDYIMVDEEMIKNSFHSFVEYVRGKEAVKGIQKLDGVHISVITEARNCISQFYSRGCSDYIMKPLNKDKIVNRLQTCL